MGRARPHTVNILIGLLSQGQIQPLAALTGLKEYLSFPCDRIVWIHLGENQFKSSDHLASLAGLQVVFIKSSGKVMGIANVTLTALQTAQNIERDGR